MSITLEETLDSSTLPTVDSFSFTCNQSDVGGYKKITAVAPENLSFSGLSVYGINPNALEVIYSVDKSKAPSSFVNKGKVYDLEKIDFEIHLVRSSKTSNVNIDLVTKISSVAQTALGESSTSDEIVLEWSCDSIPLDFSVFGTAFGDEMHSLSFFFTKA